MSQYDRDISGQTTGTQLVDDFNQSMAAIHSGHIGTTRPPYARRGMTWTKEGSPDKLMYFDGTSDTALFNLNESLSGQIGTPIGGIIMWHGSAANIPEGWALCDGQNGTPDLRGRFVVGAGGTHSPNTSGGSDSVTLSVSNLPVHDHGAGGLTANQSGEHTHGATDSGVGIQYFYKTMFTTSYTDGASLVRVILDGNVDGASVDSFDPHSHTIRVNSDGEHTHDISGSTASAGGGQPVNVTPPYYALCYIMKV